MVWAKQIKWERGIIKNVPSMFAPTRWNVAKNQILWMFKPWTRGKEQWLGSLLHVIRSFLMLPWWNLLSVMNSLSLTLPDNHWDAQNFTANKPSKRGIGLQRSFISCRVPSKLRSTLNLNFASFGICGSDVLVPRAAGLTGAEPVRFEDGLEAHLFWDCQNSGCV